MPPVRHPRLAIAAVLLAFVAIAAYWHFSPYLTIRALRAAAEARDFEQLHPHVDYPLLRANLKEQLDAALAGRLQGASGPLAGLAGRLGTLAIGGLVETFVRPVTLMTVLRTGQAAAAPTQPPPRPEPDASGGSVPPRSPGGSAVPDEPQLRWRIDRIGTDRVIVFPKVEADDPGVGVVIDRRGFATWRVSGLRLPPSLLGGAQPAR